VKYSWCEFLNKISDRRVSEKLNVALVVVPAVSILLHVGIRIKIGRFSHQISPEAANSFKAGLDSQVISILILNSLFKFYCRKGGGLMSSAFIVLQP
jgi:hypothetical protein